MTAAALPLLLAAHLAAAPAREPARIIFDTDMGNDVDDAMALALLHALWSRDECRVLAVTLTKSDPLAGPFCAALNAFYGRGTIPVGIRRAREGSGGSKFLKLASERDGDQPRYPHTLDPATAPDAVPLLRQVLAGQPDGSVSIVQVGFSSNLATLLDTPADAASPLPGKELVKAKVKLLSIMAGAFATIDHNNRYLEYNVTNDRAACRKLAAEWPTPVVWSGFEIGIAIPYPAASVERDYAYVEHHIVAEAYRLYCGPGHDRPTWDLTSALYAVRPDRGYFDLSRPGRVTVEEDGFTRFTPQNNGRDRFLLVNQQQLARTREALVQLTSQPPDKIAR